MVRGPTRVGEVAAAANRRDDGLLAATLDTLVVVGVLPAQPVVHLDAGNDYQPCRQALAERGMLGKIATRASRHRSRRADGGRSSAPTPGATSTGKLRWCTERRQLVVAFGWRWPTPPSSAAGWSVAPGPATAGRPDPAAAHNHLLAQALSL
jgi:hypothetical protein